MKHEYAYRAVFLAAGTYNIIWGIWSVADPQWFFRLIGLPPSNTPQIFATLGMVLGLYGILYLDVARRPAQGWLVAAVALAGKILGPFGLAWLIITGVWPPDTMILVLTNDLLWWIPFAWYLRDAWPAFRHGEDRQAGTRRCTRPVRGEQGRCGEHHPAGREHDGGVISSVGRVATRHGSGATIGVLVRLDHRGAAGHLDQAPVTVNITTSQVRNALAVPVAALVARPGGYAVEVVSGGDHRLVPVRVQLAADVLAPRYPSRGVASWAGLARGLRDRLRLAWPASRSTGIDRSSER